MSGESGEHRGRAGESKPPKIRAEDNPWYLLATLYGVPENMQDERWARNRRNWNRYFAAELDEITKARLIEEKQYSKEELTSFSPEEENEIAKRLAERKGLANTTLDPPPRGTPVDFQRVHFDRHAFFDGYLFTYCSFRNARFSNDADASFEGATFCRKAHFDGATLLGTARFHRAHFLAMATFDRATFSGLTMFSHATFSVLTIFNNANFSGHAGFVCATFSGDARFDDTTFSREALFTNAVFCGETHFTNAMFEKTCSFVNAEMKGETSFEGAIFKTEPPRFFGAKLHQGTVWRGIEWPKKPKDKEEAGSFIDAYACLKLEMDRLKKHEDELDFFALELQSRRVLLGALSLESWVIATYGLLSNYGRNYFKPFVALIVVAVIGAVVFWYFDAHTIGEALFLSAANTLNVFGFRRDFFEASCIEGQPAVLKFVAAAQTIIGTILLFLFGLGIRNKFRMK